MQRLSRNMVPSKRPRHRVDRERGIALVAVLCVLSLLTVLAVGALEMTRRHGQLAHRSFEAVQASEMADSAIRVALLEITAPPVPTAWQPISNLRTVRVFDQSVDVRIEREAQRVDLNAADESELMSALLSQGMADSDARALAARIVDWRDVDDEAGIQGAERAEYRRANRSGPRNAPFETISELRQVSGAEDLTENMLNAFTVYSHARVAERPATDGSAQRLSELGGLAGEAVRLTACAAVLKTTVCREGIVRLTGNRVQPALIYSWRTREREDTNSAVRSP
jgi:general secretion pathway protein K